MAGKALDVDLEEVALSVKDTKILLDATRESFGIALANHAEIPLLTTGTLAIFLVDGLVEALDKVELDQGTRALALRELGGCLEWMAAKYSGGMH